MVLGMPTFSERRTALNALPTDLYDSFQGIITRIRRHPISSQAKLGIQVLMWLHFAYRPLMLKELQHALAVRKCHKEFDMGYIPPRKALLDSCLGLVVVDEETMTVRFVHYTLEEYFGKYSKEEFPNGYCSIAVTCLTYLNFGKLKQYCPDKDILREKRDEYAFLNYAARYWGTYVKQQCDNDLTELIKMLVDHEIERPPCAIQVLPLELYSTWFPYKFSGIHAIAFFGLSHIMAYFCSSDVELRDRTNRTPLSWAAGNGHEAVVRLLIERGDVDINAKDYYRRSSLLYAAQNGHEAIVRLLTERGDVDINAKDLCGQTPLTWAAQNGHEAVVRLLIERGDVDINAKDSEYGRTSLIWAAKNGHKAVVQLLIERGDVDINAKDNLGRTSLMWALKNGHEAIVQLLNDRSNALFRNSDIAPPGSFSGDVAAVEAEAVDGVTSSAAHAVSQLQEF